MISTRYTPTPSRFGMAVVTTSGFRNIGLLHTAANALEILKKGGTIGGNYADTTKADTNGAFAQKIVENAVALSKKDGGLELTASDFKIN